eukprot:GHVN01023794.1.p1 GENE.GHVN01023794.1~~GHVN01023794.1.p1  ORF type:complete len:212 (-),score=18.56 GHVN01023794.1:424-1059(-)
MSDEESFASTFLPCKRPILCTDPQATSKRGDGSTSPLEVESDMEAFCARKWYRSSTRRLPSFQSMEVEIAPPFVNIMDVRTIGSRIVFVTEAYDHSKQSRTIEPSMNSTATYRSNVSEERRDGRRAGSLRADLRVVNRDTLSIERDIQLDSEGLNCVDGTICCHPFSLSNYSLVPRFSMTVFGDSLVVGDERGICRIMSSETYELRRSITG